MRTTLFLLIPVVLGIFPSLTVTAQFQPLSQSQQCFDADGQSYPEGAKLGPFICKEGQWVYDGYMH